MRNRESKRKEGVRCRKMLLIVALGAAGLLAALPAMAAEANLPTSCTTASGWTVRVTAGPCATSDAGTSGGLTCDSAGLNTGIEYTVTGPGTPDHTFSFVHVTKLASEVLWVGGGNEGTVYAIGSGDPLSGIGLYAWHEVAARLNSEANKAGTYKIIMSGQREPIGTSVVVKKGKITDSCRIMGLGLEPAIDMSLACVPNCTTVNPEQTMTKTETMKFKGCAVKFEYDISTGELISATFDADASDKPLCGAVSSNTCCYFNQEDVANLTLTVGNVPLGHGLFGDGYISSGTGSCTTRLIGGKLYTWGCPCP